MIGVKKRKNRMYQSDLKVLVSRDVRIAQKDCLRIMKSTFRNIIKFVERGHMISIDEFGTFGTRVRKGRTFKGLKGQPDEFKTEKRRHMYFQPMPKIKKRIRARAEFMPEE